MPFRPRSLVASLAVLACGLVLLTACGSNAKPGGAGGSTTTTGSPAGALGGTSWDLVSYRGPAGDVVPAAAGATATLAFAADGTLAGSTGCNGFGGSYVADGADLTLSLGAMTTIGCAEAAIQAQEMAFTTLMPQVTGFQVADGRLTLTDAGGATLLTFTEGLTELAGTNWKVSGVDNGRGWVTSSLATEQLTADFGADGAFSGSGGCNRLIGTYTTSGTDQVTITQLTSTEMACATDVMALEAEYVNALGKVTAYDISGGHLTLRDADGATQVTLGLAG